MAKLHSTLFISILKINIWLLSLLLNFVMTRFSNTLGSLSFISKKSKAQWNVLDVVQIRKLLSQMAFQSAFQATTELKVCGPLLYQTRIMRGYVCENLLPEIRALLDPSKFATLST